ncbi:Exodeoxyribonuclease VII small subunit [Actinopolyspora xinjiangensis]|uniref:Exodeoxyribonuclease 7 small subunit n=1 Tax=Actinopolyspora xinjiangensis TaxID=405564 RepID=A0A1H0QQL0_9ACTN|nr:exodeoxyribonuclease VII small subunit [Actinopolyspora xinjiangensis]SDP19405.1 Exodeoxyribonuclease VII small subunit [Actinopolyspora xinjiangensis]
MTSSEPERPEERAGAAPDEHGIDPETDHPDVAGFGYERARDELAEVVKRLEAGGLSLEDSLALWERGEALVAVCERHLAGARQRVDRALASVEQREEPESPDGTGQ